ncbi:NAD(P)H-binding protein [Kitasatospora sp. NPDC059795]|uniref:NAD(P)H-binding protein n=1 Tax=Kitasatospora sp. NPDC059795 TaxID=3346949 RepID=UPI0036645D4C
MIVVTGATGNVGSSLVRILAAAGARTTATSRNISAADVPDHVPHRRADLADPHALRAVFDGAEALFLQNGGPSAHLLNPRDILDVAEAAGIRRVVLLSSQGVATRPDSQSHGAVALAFEDAVRQSGLAWTILRPSGFHSNAYAWAESVRTHRTVAAPFADVALPHIDPDDIAEVAALALRAGDHDGHDDHDDHDGRIYELTGPSATTPRRQAEALADALGEPVRFVELTRDEARAHLLRLMPEAVADTTLSILGDPTPAERRISPDVERLLGRAPRTFADWAQRYVAAFR